VTARPAAPAAAAVRSAEDIADQAADLRGIHPGIDAICDGALLLATDPNLDLDRTQTLLACLGGMGHGDPDVIGLLTALVRHLGDPATNPCLAELPPERAAEMTGLVGKFAADVEDCTPRHHLAEAAAVIDES